MNDLHFSIDVRATVDSSMRQTPVAVIQNFERDVEYDPLRIAVTVHGL
jgi:hypothetical protein